MHIPKTAKTALYLGLIVINMQVLTGLAMVNYTPVSKETSYLVAGLFTVFGVLAALNQRIDWGASHRIQGLNKRRSNNSIAILAVITAVVNNGVLWKITGTIIIVLGIFVSAMLTLVIYKLHEAEKASRILNSTS